MAHRTVLLIGENQNDVEEIKSVLPSDKYEIVGETTDGERGLDILKEFSLSGLMTIWSKLSWIGSIESFRSLMNNDPTVVFNFIFLMSSSSVKRGIVRFLSLL